MTENTPQSHRAQATVDNPVVVKEKDRYALYVDDTDKPAGFTKISDFEGASGMERIFPHTEVDEEYSGKGLASTLVRAAVEDTVASGAKIVALCPYVKSWVDRHDEFTQHLVNPTSEHLNALHG